MKSKIILKKNSIILLIAVVLGFVLDLFALLYVNIVLGLDNIDKLDMFEYYIVLALLPISFVCAFVLLLGSERLKVQENSVAKYKWFTKVKEINWSDVVSVEREVIRNGISKTEKPTMTEIFVVLNLVDNTKMYFMFSNKCFNTLKTYFDNTRHSNNF